MGNPFDGMPVLEKEAKQLAEVIIEGHKPTIHKDRRGFHYEQETGLICNKKGKTLEGDELFEAIFAKEGQIIKRKTMENSDFSESQDSPYENPLLISIKNLLGGKKYTHIFIGDTNHKHFSNNIEFFNSSMDVLSKTGQSFVLELPEKYICEAFNRTLENNIDLNPTTFGKSINNGFKNITLDEMQSNHSDFIYKISKVLMNGDNESKVTQAEGLYNLLIEAKKNNVTIIFGEESVVEVNGFSKSEVQDKSTDLFTIHASNITKAVLALGLKSPEEMLSSLPPPITLDIPEEFKADIPPLKTREDFIEELYEASIKLKEKLKVLSPAQKDVLGAILLRDSPVSMLLNSGMKERDNYLETVVSDKGSTVMFRGYGHFMTSNDMDEKYNEKQNFEAALFRDEKYIQEHFQLILSELGNDNKFLEYVKSACKIKDEFDGTKLELQYLELPQYIMFSDSKRMYKTDEYLKNNPELINLLKENIYAFDEKSRDIINKAFIPVSEEVQKAPHR